MDAPLQKPTASEPMLLGGNIELAGFNTLDAGSMTVLKKIIGNYARKFSDAHGNEKLSLQLQDNGSILVLSGHVQCKGKKLVAEYSDKNVFFLVDTVLKQLEEQLKQSL